MKKKRDVAETIIDRLKRFDADLAADKNFRITTIRRESTPDGPLTTRTVRIGKIGDTEPSR